MNTLLQLGNIDTIDNAIVNDEILLVERPPLKDFARDLAVQEQEVDTDESDKTVDYNQPDQTEKNPEEEKSPKGVMRYKHYSIKRHSPTTENT